MLLSCVWAGPEHRDDSQIGIVVAPSAPSALVRGLLDLNDILPVWLYRAGGAEFENVVRDEAADASVECIFGSVAEGRSAAGGRVPAP